MDHKDWWNEDLLKERDTTGMSFLHMRVTEEEMRPLLVRDTHLTISEQENAERIRQFEEDRIQRAYALQASTPFFTQELLQDCPGLKAHIERCMRLGLYGVDGNYVREDLPSEEFPYKLHSTYDQLTAKVNKTCKTFTHYDILNGDSFREQLWNFISGQKGFPIQYTTILSYSPEWNLRQLSQNMEEWSSLFRRKYW